MSLSLPSERPYCDNASCPLYGIHDEHFDCSTPRTVCSTAIPEAELIVYVREIDVDAYTAQGWRCWRLVGHFGQRPTYKNFLCVLEPIT